MKKKVLRARRLEQETPIVAEPIKETKPKKKVK